MRTRVTELLGIRYPPQALLAEIARCRTMTSKPFAMNLTILPSSSAPPYMDYARAIVGRRHWAASRWEKSMFKQIVICAALISLAIAKGHQRCCDGLDVV